jgi:predicted Fe-Mo cluster-binding NifX family protein
MKVVVTSTGESLNSLVDQRFGRAAVFVMVDTGSGETTSEDNAAGVNAAQGAGVQAAETVARLGAKRLVTGHCGPKAFRTLEAAGIEVFTGATGTVAEAVEQLEAGRLQRLTGPDRKGHWG